MPNVHTGIDPPYLRNPCKTAEIKLIGREEFCGLLFDLISRPSIAPKVWHDPRGWQAAGGPLWWEGAKSAKHRHWHFSFSYIVQHRATPWDDVMTVFDHVGCLRDACCVRAEMELKTPQPLDIAAGQFDLASCAAGVATPVSCEVHCGCCDCEPWDARVCSRATDRYLARCKAQVSSIGSSWFCHSLM